MRWVQDPSQSILDNLHSVRHEAERHQKEVKVEELETSSKIKSIRDLYRGVNDFKKGYRPRTNILKDDKGDLVADS